MIVDLGTGDGRAALAAAAADPRALVLGIDADATSMAEASRSAARPIRKGGRPNALFIAAGVAALDPVLDGRADLVTVTLPWGSLVRGALAVGGAETVMRAIARLPKANGRVEMLLSVTPRDGIAGCPASTRRRSPASRHATGRAASASSRLARRPPPTWPRHPRPGRGASWVVKPTVTSGASSSGA